MVKGELNFESKEAIQRVLQEYEIHTKLIEQQLEVCKEDHADLQSEITKLIHENKDLTHQLKMASENAIFRGEQALFSDKSDNLKQQLDLALEERDTLEDLWKSSIKELETVKEKLRDYQSGVQLTKTQNKLNDVQRDYSEAIQILESKISILKAENDQLIAKNDYMEKQQLQACNQITEIKEKNLSLSNQINEVTNKEQEWKSRFLLLEAKYIELDKTYQADRVKFARIYQYERLEAQLEGKLEVAINQRDELQDALEMCHDRIAALMTRAENDRCKIEEAVCLVEEALQGRNEALAREASSTEEINKIKTQFNKVVEEAGVRVGEEVASVRNQYQKLTTALREELLLVKQERDRKVQEVQQWQEECERLQNWKDQMKAPSDQVQGDKQHLAKAYKELQFTEVECEQLHFENDQLLFENKQLHEALCQLQERCRKNSRAKVKLKQELKNVQEQCQTCQHELAVTLEKADVVNRQLQQTNLELSKLQSEAILYRDRAASTQSKVSVANTMELYKRLDDSYGQMNDKWKNEMTALTAKFDAKLKKIKKRSKTNTVPEEDEENC